MTLGTPSASRMRVIFMGSPEFAVPSLEALVHEGFEVCMVCTPPDKRRSRGGPPEPTPVKKKAMELGLTVQDVLDVHDPEFHRTLRALKADLSVVVAFRLLPNAVLDATRLGAVNIHASLLPAYRGAAPIHHAVLNGEKETGCTLFVLNQQMDAGQILAQKTSPIHPDDTTGDVYERLQTLGAKLLVETLPAWDRGELTPVHQDDRKATPAPKVFSEDGWLRLELSAGQVHNQARAMTPTPGAWIRVQNEKVKIHRTKTLELSELPSFSRDVKPLELGTLTLWNKRLFVGCGEQTALEIVRLQQPGKTPITGYEYSLGRELDQLHVEYSPGL